MNFVEDNSRWKQSPVLIATIPVIVGIKVITILEEIFYFHRSYLELPNATIWTKLQHHLIWNNFLSYRYSIISLSYLSLVFKRLNNNQFSKRSNDIHVTQKTNFNPQLERCVKLISSNGNHREIHTFSMGSAWQRTINIALKFQLKTTCQLQTNIASFEVTDHLIPLLDDWKPMNDTRWVFTIHIMCTFPSILTETK